MRVTALAAHTPEAVRAALAARGWESQPAWFAATGIQPLVLVIEEISDDEREALVHWGAKSGVDVLTGASGLGAGAWALVAGSTSRLAPLARYDRAPAELARLAPILGQALAARAEPSRTWAIRGGEISLEKPAIIGIVNVTPDSFSDGGHLPSAEAAIEHGRRLMADGCQLLDIGGESTRPGASPISAKEEIARVVPVIAGLAKRNVGPISVDTRKAEVARAALDAGAAVVNDVSGGRFDADLPNVVRESGAGMILMHMRGTPATMDEHARYGQVAAEVAAELRGLAQQAEQGGIGRERIVVDPGFGFAKTATQNLRLLDELATIVAVGYPVAVGPSRKRFLGAATGRPVEDRDRATAVACAFAWERGARLFRVHDVALTVEALSLASATTKPA
ncbi:MAG TPA: dihydropteroate synthase [Gemmatimonadales bacterium]|nr:dihydropteroate synthase [Gemmatimonadales bacterium]